MSISNACGTGHCMAMVSAAAIRVCRDTEYDDWNGLCPYQSGNKVTSEQEAAGVVVLDCCDDGCEMNVHDYARWNSLCAHMTGDSRMAVKGVRPDGLIVDESESVAEITQEVPMSTDVIQSLAARLDKTLPCCTVELVSDPGSHQLKIHSTDGNRLISTTMCTVEQMEAFLKHLLGVPVFLNLLLDSYAHYISKYNSTIPV